MSGAVERMPPHEPDLRPLRERLADLTLERTEIEAANDHLYAAGLTDGLPVIPPTEARIAAMLRDCRTAPDTLLDVLMPSFVAPSLWDVAVCAVMAGCQPTYLPVVVAALRAL